MKKLSFALALILACGMLASCGGNSDTTSDSGSGSSTPAGGSEAPTSTSTPNSTTNDPATTDPTTTTTNTENPDPGPTEEPQDELLDASRFTVDGELGEGEWEGLNSLTLEGEATTAHKKVTFYAATTTEGLYLACDAYHDLYSRGRTDGWWFNSNFEIFIDEFGLHHQVYAYADGIGADCLTGKRDTAQITSAVMKTTETDYPTKYHTITEVFISNEDLPEESMWMNTVSVGVAWKTVGDLIIGGYYTQNEDGSDEYWGLPGASVDSCSLVATPKGLFWYDDYMEE